MLKAVCAAFVLAAMPMSALAAPQAAYAADLTDTWTGVYIDPANQGNSARFEAKLQRTADGRFQGTLLEDNNWSPEPLAFLLSTVEGKIEGATVSFTKTYVASGEVRHSVQYTGTLDPSGRRIAGTWGIGGNTGGQFEMVR